MPHGRRAPPRLASRATRRADFLPVVFSRARSGRPVGQNCARASGRPDFMSENLSVRGITVTVGDSALVRDVSFDLAPGEFIALIGPNGAGKTTLLRAALGLLKPHPGAGASRGPGHSAARAARAGAAGFLSAADASARLAPGGAGRGGARTLCVRRGPRPAVRTRRRGGGRGARGLRPRSPQGSFRRDLVRWRTARECTAPGRWPPKRRCWLPTSRWRRSTRATNSR